MATTRTADLTQIQCAELLAAQPQRSVADTLAGAMMPV
jgi:hypothetical protein